MERSEEATVASDDDNKEGARQEASRHVDQHGQSCIDILKSRTIEGSRGVKVTIDEDNKESARQREFRHADQSTWQRVLGKNHFSTLVFRFQ